MLLIGNGRLISHDKENPYFENGAVLIKGNEIKEVGNYSDMKEKYKDVKFIDAKGKVIMPGIINTHTHIYSSFARGMQLNGPANTNFLEILDGLWWRLDKALLEEDNKYSAYTTYLDCVRYGVTTVFDHHASPFSASGSLFKLGEAADDIGVRACLSYEVTDRDGEDVTNAGIKENIEYIKANKNSEMQKGMFGLHASFTLSDKTLEQCASEMESVDAGYHVHVAEGIEDAEDSIEKHKKPVVNRLDDFGIFRENSIAVHCIHVSDDELDLLNERKTNVVHNPESNMGNAVGCCPAIKMMAKGIKVGLGTDGYTADIFESIKVANIIHKHHLKNPTVAWSEVQKMAFEINLDIAKMYFNKDIGVLKKGAAADIILLEYNPLTPMHENNYYSHILFGLMGKSVTDTIINGKEVMRNRVILTIDEEEVYAKSRELAQKVWDRA